MIVTLSPELQNHESLKGFEKEDDLGKAYLDLHAKASSGSLDLLPEDIRNNETVKVYKTTHDLAKGLIETKKLVGSIKRPPADSTGYKFTAVDGLHPSIKPDANFQKALAENALKLGLAEDQADGVHKLAMGYVSQLVSNTEKQREENYKKNDAELRQEWGGDYDKNFNGVVRMLTKAGGEDVGKELGAALQKAPQALKALARISSLLSEDSIESLGGSGGGGGKETDKEFEAMRDAIRLNDQKHPLMNERDPKHAAAVERWTQLSKEFHSREK